MRSVSVVRLAQNGGGLLDCSSSSGEPFLIDGKFRAAGIDGGDETFDGEICEFLGDGLESDTDVIELAGHPQIMTHQQ